jgi:putative transposase
MSKRRRHTPEQIIAKLREAEVLIAQGQTVDQAARQIGATVQTYYRWREEYGGLKLDQARRLKQPEGEDARLKRLLADAELDKAILKEAAAGKF